MNIEISPKCNIINTNGLKFEVINCLKIDQKKSNEEYETIYIIPNHEYRIKFYCDCNSNIKTIECKVDMVYKDQIRLIYNPKTDLKYNMASIFSIPIENILNVEKISESGEDQL